MRLHSHWSERAAPLALAALLSALLCASAIFGCDASRPGVDSSGDGGPTLSADGAGPDADADAPDAHTLSDASSLDTASLDASSSGDAGAPPDAGALSDGGADASCTPLDSCDNLCGPVFDSCLGKSIQCGACKEASLVCEIEKHQCIVPASSCSALGAQCGKVKTSCGIHIDCGDCPSADKECDPKTNQCVACTKVSCADLGYQCGTAWNGCGPQNLAGPDGGLAANQLDCGACPDTSSVCNSALHLCEPQCAPIPLDSVICDAAKALGVECGYITNGCGGLANCGGCPAGQKCGTRGVANRCEPVETSVECYVLGQNCGSIQSACGGTTSCGTCTGTDTCNANGVCGAPCVPKACAADYQGQCGIGLDDECGGAIRCDCASGKGCSTLVSGQVGTCGDYQACSGLGATGLPGAPCSNGASASFPKGDGTNLTCKCSGAAVCVAGGAVVQGGAAGTCCQNGATCGNSCNTHVVDTCTGAQIACTCGSGFHCEGTTCAADKTCATHSANGASGNVCSNGASASFPKGDGTNLVCQCTESGTVCISGTAPNGTVVSGANTGVCCKNANSCAAGSCNTSSVDTCTGATVTCNTCSSSQHCEGTACAANKTCATPYGANGAAGNPCSVNPAFDRGDGQLFTCACTAGVCSSGGHLVTGTDKGTCCLNANAACDGNHCNDALHPYSVTDSCTGAVTACGCNAARYCKDGSCLPLETCATYTDQKVPHACSNGADPDFPKGDGSFLTCRCTESGAVCISDDGSGTVVSGAATGHCCKNANSCAAGSCNTSYVDTCTGTTVACNTCSSSQHCEGTTCAANFTCSKYTTQGLGDKCSNGADPDFPKGNGTNLTCTCSTSGAVCISDTEPHGTVVSGATTGLCCKNTNSCAAGSCNTSYTDTCTGATVACNTCSSSQHCEGTTCTANKTCSTYGANGASGNPCSANASFDRGDGQLFTCGCTSPGACSSGGHLVTGTAQGTCCVNTVACASDACATSVINECSGAAIACSSTCSDSSKHCDITQKKCVDNFTCAAYAANGKLGQACSAVATSKFPKGDGTNLTCACSQNGGPSGESTPNIQCTGSSATASGTCTCVPTSCTVLGAGPHPNDGCGHSINCSG